jgi:Tol biopolymer transport system component
VARTLLPGQSSRILLVDALTGETEVVFESDTVLVEAPNWTPDGRQLVVNADGGLWRLPVEGGALTPVAMPGVPEINNDHVLAPEGDAVYVSGRDGHIYSVPLGPGEVRRITRAHPEDRGYKNYLHGVSPDGSTLAVIVGSRPAPTSALDEWRTDVALVDVASGSTTPVTDDEHFDDGAEFSPDGAWIWFNSERFTDAPGHAQLARVRRDGSALERVAPSSTVDWFPHVSPDGSSLVYLAYPASTQGHPANVKVVIRALPLVDGDPGPSSPRDLVRLFGGQGTLNVTGWAPDSRRFAAVDYPIAG